MLDQKMKKRRKHGTKNAAAKKPKMANVPEDQDSNAEVNYPESDVTRTLDGEILIVDEAGNVYFGEFENTAVEFCHETTVGEPPIVPEDVMCVAVGEPPIVAEDVMYLDVGEPPIVAEDVMYLDVGEPPIVAEDVMYVDESGTIYGSLVEYPAEVGHEIVEKNEENEEHSETIFYVDELGNISLSMNTNNKLIESDIALPVEMLDDEQRHENYDSDLETQTKIRRLKEEICSLEERIRYIESLEEHVD